MRTPITILIVVVASILSLLISPASIAVLAAPRGGPDPEKISADALWLAHVDLEGALDTRLGRLILEGVNAGLHNELAELESHLGFNPLNEVHRVTAYGLPGDHQPPIVLLEASEAVDRVIETMRAEQTDVIEEVVEGFEIIRWPEGAASIRDAGGDRRLVVAAPDSSALITALRTIDGALPSAADVEHPAFASPVREGAFLAIIVPNADAIRNMLPPGEDQLPEVLRQARALSLQIGEGDGLAYIDAACGTESEEEAQDVAQLTGGLMALSRMMLREDPEFAQLDPLLRAISIKAEGAQVRFLLEMPAEHLPETLEPPGAVEDDDLVVIETGDAGDQSSE